MPRDGAITFRDIVGKLTVLRITCDKCGRSGQYRVDRLIMRYGIDAKLFDWLDDITADCPRKQAKNFRRTVPGSAEGGVIGPILAESTL